MFGIYTHLTFHLNLSMYICGLHCVCQEEPYLVTSTLHMAHNSSPIQRYIIWSTYETNEREKFVITHKNKSLLQIKSLKKFEY